MKKIKDTTACAITAAEIALAATANAYGVGLPQLHEYFGIEGELTKSIIHTDYDTRFTHAGVLDENREYRDNMRGNESGSDIDLSIGGGALFKFTHPMNLVAEITFIESNIIHASAGAQFKF